MDRQPLWKPLLIVAVLALSLLSLYPPRERLRLGLDLAGGTTFVYQVNLPPDATDPEREIDDVIAVLRNRVDPTGVRNLSWRQLAGHRIEIQMPLASPKAVELRAQYREAREALLARNISRRELDALLRSPSRAEIERLAQGDAQRQAALEALVRAHEALEAARGPYEEAQRAALEAERALQDLPASADAAERQRLQEALDARVAALEPLTRAYVDAEREYRRARAAVLDANVEAAELERVLALSTQVDPRLARETGEQRPPRVAGVERLIAEHPQRAEEIRDVVQKYEAYERLKGPLDDPADLIRLLRGSGVLEFRIAAQRGAVPNAEEYVRQLDARGPRGGEGDPYRWFPIDDPGSFASRPREVQQLLDDPEGYLGQRGLIARRYGEQIYLLLANTPDASMTQAQPGWELTSAYPAADKDNLPAVSFSLNAAGASLMGDLTGRHVGRPMAIVLDDRVISAPTINERIAGSGIISGGPGGFNERERSYLVRTLKAGALKARLSEEPISTQTVGPQLGRENLWAGLKAATVALVLVMIFMAAYYLVLGLIADFALLANVLIILGVMSVIDATFTLAGIAGVILTIGMAVDANVLIFERIREELERNAPVRTAVRLGYQRALTTIIDSNLTTLITCVILYYFGTADIKGFGLTLGIGLAASMFTAVFCSRVILEGYLRLTGAQSLPTLPMLVPAIRRLLTPNIDWIGKRHYFIAASLVLIAAGMVALFLRGRDFLDIEFRSGTQVTFQLAGDAWLSREDVRQRLDRAAQQHNLPKLRGGRATIVTVGPTRVEGGSISAQAFSIATLEEDAPDVSAAIKSAFGDVLDVPAIVSFAAMDAKSVGRPIYPIVDGGLGRNLAGTGRRELTQARDDVTDYLGGVAIVLDEMNPPLTVEELRRRIEATRMQSTFEGYGYRNFEVIGLEPAPEGPGAPGAAGPPRYRSAVVVSRAEGVNYAETPDAVAEPGGLAQTEWEIVSAALRQDVSLGSVSNFTSAVSATMRNQAIIAVLLSCVLMLAYIWFRFGDMRYGVGAVVALVHDVALAIGLAALAGFLVDSPVGAALGLSPFRLNLSMIAATLTLIGYSVNDTIVTFDRIRENRGRLAYASKGVINDSINQTFSRTVLTAGTTLLASLALYVLGGEAVHGFAFIMLVGVIAGTYSSIAIASPLLLLGQRGAEAARAARPVEKQSPAVPAAR